jgi:hypothetical protein
VDVLSGRQRNQEKSVLCHEDEAREGIVQIRNIAILAATDWDKRDMQTERLDKI